MDKIPTEAPAQAKKSNQEHIILAWDAPEFIKHPKGKTWFIVAGLAVAGLVVYAILTNSWTMAVAFIVLAGVYYLTHHQEPRVVQIRLTDLGIHVGARTIPYNQIKAFWLVYHPPAVKTLKLLTTDKLMAEMTIQLDGQSPGAVRKALLKQIPEFEGKTESFVDILIRATRL